MIVYVVGEKKVKGVSGKECYYVGTVQDDGYIYFEDDYSYRCATPTLTEDSSTNITNAQVYYPLTKRWIKCMHFRNLTVRPFVVHNLYVRVGQNERNIVALGNEVTTLRGQVTSLSNEVGNLRTEVTTLRQTVATYNQAIADLVGRTNTLLTWLNQLGNYALGDGAAAAYTGNGEVLLNVMSKVNGIIDIVNIQHSAGISKLTDSVWNDWNDRSF